MHISVRKKIFKFKDFHSPRKSYENLSEQQSILVSSFNNKIKDGEIKFESVPCLCGNTEFELIASVDRYGILQRTGLCIHCGLILSNPRMTAEEYSNFYSSDLYRICYQGNDYREICERKYTQKAGQHIFDEVNKAKPINTNTTILEFGAGGGWNLLPFIKAGAKVLGMDYSPTLVKLGNEHEINMAQGSFNDVRGFYDVIILNHVLEHFLNPVDSLKTIARHLSKDGIIYIAVPNIINFGMGQLQNAHTYYFTPETFVYYCKQSGLKPIREGVAEQIHMFGIFELYTSTITCNFEPQKNYVRISKLLRKVKFKEYMKTILRYMCLEKIVRFIRHRISISCAW